MIVTPAGSLELAIPTYTAGTYTADEIDLSGLADEKDLAIRWGADVPGACSLTIEARISLDGGVTWTQWAEASDGGRWPGYTVEDDLSSARAQWRATMSTQDDQATPTLRSVTPVADYGKRAMRWDCHRHYTGVLVPASRRAFADVDLTASEPIIAEPVAEYRYQTEVVELEHEGEVRVYPQITARRASWLPEGVATVSPRLRSEPDGGPWTAYEPWRIGQRTLRRVQMQAVVDCRDGAVFLAAFTPTVDVQPRTIVNRVMSIDPAGTRVTYDPLVYRLPSVSVTPTVAGRRWYITAHDETGVTLHLEQADGSAIPSAEDASVNITVSGDEQ